MNSFNVLGTVYYHLYPDLLQSVLKALNSEQGTVFEKDKNLRNNLVFSFTVTLKTKMVVLFTLKH